MNHNLRGILAMSASVIAFIFNDALIKLAAETVPAIQAIGLRGVFATFWCALALLVTGAWRHVGRIASKPVLLRGGLEAASAIAYLIALFHIPVAVATAVNMATPIFLTVLAVIVLREDVRWRRWLAIVAGFVGVLMVVQPQPGQVDVWTWLVVLASLVAAGRDLMARYLPAGMPTLVMSFASATAVALVGVPWALIEGWQPMQWREVGLLVASSLLLAAGYQFVVLALRSNAEFSVVSSFRYTSVLWGIAIGYVVWGDVPNALALAGIAVIVGAGLYILHRERIRRG